MYFNVRNNYFYLIKSFQCRFLSNVKIRKSQSLKTSNSQPSSSTNAFDVTKIRNVGIIAHIDAGKTTTTERMLYYSGASKSIGNVDDGNTVTDFMEQERERGITIMSAVVHFMWKGFKVNLIDTPGHIDFTCEVESSLMVLDGAVLVLDASAGVEAQTLSTWRQALKYKIPQIAFINKMDKSGASYTKSVQSISEKLGRTPLPLQLPIMSTSDNSFSGVVDLINMTKQIWRDDGDGRSYKKINLDPEVDGALYETAVSQRTQMLECLVNMDDELGEMYLGDSTLANLTVDQLEHAIKRVTHKCQVLPILCGSSLRNKGVQPLMDSIVTYLPDPIKRDLIGRSGSDLDSDRMTMAFAFKIIHDKNHLPVTFLRVYSGHLSSGLTLFNSTKNCKEKMERMYRINADEYDPVERGCRGNIVAVTGLKETRTGDILFGSSSPSTPPPPSDLPTIHIPDPVYFCSVEPPSLSSQKGLDSALECLAREDPSLKVKVDPYTGQTVLGGMGQLHLEVIKSRILTEYGIDVDLGPLQIAYKETLKCIKRTRTTFEKTIGETKYRVEMIATFYPTHFSGESGEDKEKLFGKKKEKSLFRIVPDVDSALMKQALKPMFVKAIEDGLMAGFSKGPLLGYPLNNVRMELNEFLTNSKTTLPIISSCVAQSVREAIKRDDVYLLQPVMEVEVFTTPDHLGTVLSDLSQRESHILSVNKREGGGYGDATVVARTPLSRLENFSTVLRSKTSGLASFNLTLSSYDRVSEKLLDVLING